MKKILFLLLIASIGFLVSQTGTDLGKLKNQYADYKLSQLKPDTLDLSSSDRLEIVAFLKDDNFDELDFALQGHYQAFIGNIKHELAFESAVNVACSFPNSKIDRWIERNSDSAFALYARACKRSRNAWNARGGKFSDDTSRKKFLAMDDWIKLADRDAHQLLDRKPDFLPAYTLLIAHAALQARSDDKLLYLNQSLENKAENYTVRQTYTYYLQPKWGGSWETAQEFAEQAQDQAGHNPLLEDLASYVYRMQAEQLDKKDMELALSYYQKSADIYPSHLSYYGMAKLHSSNKDYLEALKYADIALRIRNTDFKLRKSYAWYLSKLKRYPESVEALSALDYYSQAITLDPKDDDAYRDRASVYLWDLKKYQAAEQDIRKAVSIKPKAYYWYILAKALHRQQYPESVAATQRYLAACRGENENCFDAGLEWSQQFISCLATESSCSKKQVRVHLPWLTMIKNNDIPRPITQSQITQLELQSSWTPPEKPDSNAILNQASKDIKNKDYSSALSKLQWYIQRAHEYSKPNNLHFPVAFELLSDLLGAYPETEKSLTLIRDRALLAVKANIQPRQNFYRVLMINGSLNEDTHTVDSFKWLSKNNTTLAEKLYRAVQATLISTKEYQISLSFVRPEQDISRLKTMYQKISEDAEFMNKGDKKIVMSRLKKEVIYRATTLVALLSVGGRSEEAIEIARISRDIFSNNSMEKSIHSALAGTFPSKPNDN